MRVDGLGGQLFDRSCGKYGCLFYALTTSNQEGVRWFLAGNISTGATFEVNLGDRITAEAGLRHTIASRSDYTGPMTLGHIGLEWSDTVELTLTRDRWGGHLELTLWRPPPA